MTSCLKHWENLILLLTRRRGKGRLWLVGSSTAFLLADDDEASLTSIAAVLSKEGYLVLTARDGFEALAELHGGLPEIIVSELKLPNMSSGAKVASDFFRAVNRISQGASWVTNRATK